MAGVMTSVNFLKSPAAGLAAALLAALAAPLRAQTWYWNPSPAGGGEIQKSMNWTSEPGGTGSRAPSLRDDAFEDTTMGPWSLIDSVRDGFSFANFTRNPGKLTIAARGIDVWVDANQYAAVYRNDFAGDFDVTVKVESQTRLSHEWAKSGIMISNNFLNAGEGGNFVVEVTRDQGYTAHYDSTNIPNPGYASTAPGRVDAPQGGNFAPATFPCWLRATRVGNVFTGYFKRNLTDPWTQIRGSYTPLNTSLGKSSQVGLFVTSHNTAVACTTVFDDFHGGGDLASNALDLSFGGTGALADNNAILGAHVGARSVDFTGYSGAFSFGGWILTLTGNATFAPTMGIHPNTGRLTFAGAAGTQVLTPKANDTLPSLWKTGAGKVQVATHTLNADSLHILAGTFDLGGNSARFQQFTAAGGALEGLTDATDTLHVSGRTDFSGLATFTPGLGTVAVKAAGAGNTTTFLPGDKLFGNLTLWTLPAGVGTAKVQVDATHLQVGGDLIFRGLHAPSGHNGEVDFGLRNANVTVTGNIGQILDGTPGQNWHPIRMGTGTWKANGNVVFTLRGGSGGGSTLELIRATGTQSVAVGWGSLTERLGTVRHTGAGTAVLGAGLNAGSLSLTAGTFDFNGQDVTLSGDLAVTGGSAILSNLGGSDFVVGGSASFLGSAGSRIPLNPASDWTIKVTGAFTADHVDVANSNATGGTTASAGANSADQGRTLNWNFGAGPTQIPAINPEPADVSAQDGQPAAFRASAAGHGPKTWQWRRVGDAAVIGTDSVLNLSSVSLSMNGYLYQCIVSNSSGKDTTREAKLTVTAKPVPAEITVEPVNQVGIEARNATFSLTAIGDAPLSYEWRKVGETAVLSTAADLTLSGLTLAQNNTSYQCIVSNAHGKDTSRPALLTVTPPPVAAEITVEAKDTTVYVTQPASFKVSAKGSPDPTFQWRREGDTTVIGTDSVLALGPTALAQDGQGYRCYVTNANGKDTSRIAVLKVLPPPVAPAIVREPSDTLVKVGARAVFSAGVLGTAPLGFEWRRKGDTALLSQDSLFVIPAATAEQSGYSYYVIVSNLSGKDTSAEARLTVRSCDSLTVEASGDVSVPEGGPVAIHGKAVCADRYEWKVLSGPAPLLLDPGADTLSFKAPRVAGDTAIRYRFIAYFGDSTKSRDVAVHIREAIPDPGFALPAAALAWNGAAPLAVKVQVFNRAQLDLHPTYPLRYQWAVDPPAADTALHADSLVLRNPSSDGPMTVTLCMDNGGAVACDTVRVDVKQQPVALLRAGNLPGGLLLQGARLTFSAPGTVRIWSLRGLLLFSASGPAGSAFELPVTALAAWRTARARLVFSGR